MALQQHRIVRFLMILGVVLLTIFIYASYYSNLTMTIPTSRVHQQQQQQQQQQSPSASLLSALNSNSNNNNNDESSGLIKNSNSIFVVADKQNIDKIQLNSGQNNQTSYARQQMIDDSNISSSSGSNLATITNSSISSSSSTSSTLSNSIRKDSSTIDLMKKSVISTTTIHNNSSVFSTLHKQNVTNSNSVGSPSSSSSSSTLSSSSVHLLAATGGNAIIPHQAVPSSPLSSSSLSSSLSSIKPPAGAVVVGVSQQQLHPQPQQQQQQQQQTSIDTSKGIPTVSIYESGHLDVNPLLCRDEGEPLKLFIVITSAPTHREARLAIRQTWGHYGVRRDVSIAFILGRTTNQAVEDALSAENYLYGDLIRGRFIDSYNNLTLKTISALEWVDKNCPQATYVLKTDDDMFINVPKLLQFIDKHSNDKRTIFGRLAKKWKPIRNKKSKYYVSPGQFALTVFPQFTTGPAYLLSSDIIHDLYIKSLEQTYLKLEDVYTTGIVAQLLNIKRIHVNEFLNRRIAFNPCNIRKAISVHMIKSNEQFDLWKKLLDTTTKCK